MPDKLANLLYNFLTQGSGKLPGRARQKEFAELTEEEAAQIENHYQQLLQQ